MAVGRLLQSWTRRDWTQIAALLGVVAALHLIGFDHATQEEYDAMFALQDDLLQGWRSL